MLRMKERTGAGGPGHHGLADTTHGEHGGCLDVIPLLLKEGIHGLLLRALLALRQAFVFADRHLEKSTA